MSELTQVDILIIVKDIVIAVVAVGGLFLGLYNLKREQKKDKVNLVIVPSSIRSLDGENTIFSKNEFFEDVSPDCLVVKIKNLSYFSVKVDEVGFLLKGTNRRLPSFRLLKTPYEAKFFDWPIKLESRDSITGYMFVKELIEDKDVSKIKAVYTRTICENLTIGKSKALEQMIQYYAKERKRKISQR
ncbi:hypothetical protein [Candidatus Albibeggiatoa sp. nov. BB20]|uniref:hypothetical protein n=1 Tax=Candidatus Albibeggiatoa sp. nov. BB20 TaxID=3162723 RepID=UPI003365A421